MKLQHMLFREAKKLVKVDKNLVSSKTHTWRLFHKNLPSWTGSTNPLGERIFSKSFGEGRFSEDPLSLNGYSVLITLFHKNTPSRHSLSHQFDESPIPQETGRPISWGKGGSREYHFPEGKIPSHKFCTIKSPRVLLTPSGRGMKQPPVCTRHAAS